MKDKKRRKRYHTKIYVVRIQSKDRPEKYLASYYFFFSKKLADAKFRLHNFPESSNEVKSFTLKASKGKELMLLLHNLQYSVEVRNESVKVGDPIQFIVVQE